MTVYRLKELLEKIENPRDVKVKLRIDNEYYCDIKQLMYQKTIESDNKTLILSHR